MPIFHFPITVYIPQLEGFHLADFLRFCIELIVAIAALVSLWIAINQLKESRKQAKAQNEQVLLQMKRENRLKMYTPLLAYLRAHMVEFNSKSSHFVLVGDENSKSEHAKQFKALKERVSSYEFTAELNLLGDPQVLSELLSWERRLQESFDKLEDLRELRRESKGIDDKNERMLFVENIRVRHKEMEEDRKNLIKDLDTLVEVIINEFQTPSTEAHPDNSKRFMRLKKWWAHQT